MSFQDPLRFGVEDDEDQLQQEVPLDFEEPEAQQPVDSALTTGETGQPSPAPPAGAQEDPLRGPPAAHFISPSPYAAASEASSSNGAKPHRSLGLTDENRDLDSHVFAREGDAKGGGRAGAVYTKIMVTDPQKCSEESVIPGFTSSHYEYLVTSVKDKQRKEVRRRFNDFVALAALLATKYRGYFVYPRPDKMTLEGQLSGNDLVKSRMTDLTNYLNHLAAHPHIGAREELAVFLTAPGRLTESLEWQGLTPLRNGGLLEGVARLPGQLLGTQPSTPSTTEAALNARDTSDLLRRFRELGKRMKQEYGNSVPHLSDAEDSLRIKRQDIESYTSKLIAASRKAEHLVKEFETHAAVMGDFGMSLIKLANFEEAEGTRAGTYTDFGADARWIATESRRIGTAAVRCRRLARIAVSHLTEDLSPLHEELAVAPAAVAALKEREDALLTQHLLQDDLDKKKQAAAALEETGATNFGSNPAKARKLAALENEISSGEQALIAAKTEYETVKSRNEQELALWRDTKQLEFAELAKEVSSLFSVCGERTAEILKSARDESRNI